MGQKVRAYHKYARGHNFPIRTTPIKISVSEQWVIFWGSPWFLAIPTLLWKVPLISFAIAGCDKYQLCSVVIDQCQYLKSQLQITGWSKVSNQDWCLHPPRGPVFLTRQQVQLTILIFCFFFLYRILKCLISISSCSADNLQPSFRYIPSWMKFWYPVI